MSFSVAMVLLFTRVFTREIQARLATHAVRQCVSASAGMLRLVLSFVPYLEAEKCGCPTLFHTAQKEPVVVIIYITITITTTS